MLVLKTPLTSGLSCTAAKVRVPLLVTATTDRFRPRVPSITLKGNIGVAGLRVSGRPNLLHGPFPLRGEQGRACGCYGNVALGKGEDYEGAVVVYLSVSVFSPSNGREIEVKGKKKERKLTCRILESGNRHLKPDP